MTYGKVLKRLGILILATVVPFAAAFYFCFREDMRTGWIPSGAEEPLSGIPSGSEGPLSGITFGGDALLDIPLYRNEEAGEWQAFLPAGYRQNAVIRTAGGAGLLLTDPDGTEILLKDGDPVRDLPTGEYFAVLESQAGSGTGGAEGTREGRETDGPQGTRESAQAEAQKLRLFFDDSLPSVFLEADEGELETITQSKGIEIRAVVSGFSEDAKLSFSEPAGLRTRGNTSSYGPKKPFYLKLKTAQSLFGLPAASHWLLLSEQEMDKDPSMMMDYIALKTADMLGLSHTPPCRYVNVYLNGRYNGMYLLTQRPDAAGGCVHLSDGILMKAGTTISDTCTFPSRYHKIALVTPNDLSSEALERLKNEVVEMEAVLDGRTEDPSVSAAQKIDYDSFIPVWLMEEFFVEKDAEYSSFYVIRNSGDEKFYAGPVWDFNYCFPYGDICTRMLYILSSRSGTDIETEWLRRLYEKEDFRSRLIRYYEERFVPVMEKWLDPENGPAVECYDTIHPSFAMDAARWDHDMYTEEELEGMLLLFRERMEFLSDYWKDPEAYACVNFHYSDQKDPPETTRDHLFDIRYYVKKGDALDRLPDSSKTLHKEVNAWKKEDGTPVKSGDRIDADTDLYPVR